MEECYFTLEEIEDFLYIPKSCIDSIDLKCLPKPNFKVSSFLVDGVEVTEQDFFSICRRLYEQETKNES